MLTSLSLQKRRNILHTIYQFCYDNDYFLFFFYVSKHKLLFNDLVIPNSVLILTPLIQPHPLISQSKHIQPSTARYKVNSKSAVEPIYTRKQPNIEVTLQQPPIPGPVKITDILYEKQTGLCYLTI